MRRRRCGCLVSGTCLSGTVARSLHVVAPFLGVRSPASSYVATFAANEAFVSTVRVIADVHQQGHVASASPQLAVWIPHVHPDKFLGTRGKPCILIGTNVNAFQGFFHRGLAVQVRLDDVALSCREFLQFFWIDNVRGAVDTLNGCAWFQCKNAAAIIADFVVGCRARSVRIVFVISFLDGSPATASACPCITREHRDLVPLLSQFWDDTPESHVEIAAQEVDMEKAQDTPQLFPKGVVFLAEARVLIDKNTTPMVSNYVGVYIVGV